MKRIISCLLLGIMLVSSVFALAEDTFTVEPKAPSGAINYSYKYQYLVFKDGETMSWMDNYIHTLTAPAEAVQDDLYVPLADLQAMYAPDFTIEADGSKLTLNHFGLTVVIDTKSADAVIDGHNYTFTNAPKEVDGIVFVPLIELNKIGFGIDAKSLGSGFYAVSYTVNALPSRISLDYYNGTLRGKEYGFVYLTYTIPDDPDQKILPLRLYIPSSYDPEKPMRAIQLLHGRSVSMNYFYPDTQEVIKYYRGIETFAEEYGYILISGTAYLVSGEYGDVDNIPYMISNTIDPIDDATKELRIRSEKSALGALNLALERYNIDTDHLYLMGNSMGGKGTLFLGNKYAEKWDAIVPCAMMPNMSLMDGNPYPNLVDMPVLFCVGTEDNYGYDLALKNWKLLDEHLNDLHFYAAAGGVHTTGWCISLPKIFEFLNAQY